MQPNRSRIWNRGGAMGLAANIGLSVGLALAVNALILLVNPKEQLQTPTYRLQPPGYVIGIVWVLLFAAMGAARWLVLGRQEGGSRMAHWVMALIVFCAAYPLYTMGLSNLTIGLLGNIATMALAVWVAGRIRATSKAAALLVCAPAVWVTFASYLILEMMLGRSI